MQQDDKAIRIRLDISIPSDGRAVQLNTTQAGQEAPPQAAQRSAVKAPDAVRLRIFTIDFPRPGVEHPVASCGSGSLGVTWASGTAIETSPGNYPAYAEASCNGGAAVRGDVDSVTGAWALDGIPNARCAVSSPYEANVLTIKYFEAGSGAPPSSSETTHFLGVCSSEGCLEQVGLHSPRAASHRTFLPGRYRFSTRGFSADLEDLSGDWQLELVPASSTSKEVVWRAERMPSQAVVELAADPADGGATLLLRLGPSEIRYHKSPGEWHPMNVSHFANCSCHATPPEASIPAIITLSPA